MAAPIAPVAAPVVLSCDGGPLELDHRGAARSPSFRGSPSLLTAVRPEQEDPWDHVPVFAATTPAVHPGRRR